MKKLFFLIASVSLLSFISFWGVLTFHFWRDDWAFLWTAQHTPFQLLEITLHPATWLEEILLIKILGWNPILWNILGILLRIIASIAAYLMTLSFFKSKTTALVACLFLATSPIGLEAIGWTSAHNTTVMIIVVCMVFYFWFLNIEKPKCVYIFLFYLLLALAIFLDPGKSLPIVPLILIWEIFLWRLKGIKNYQKTTILLLALIIVVECTYFFLPPHIKGRGGLMVNNTYQDLVVAVPNFFSSLGNLLYGSIFPIDEFTGQFPYSFIMERFALSFFILIGGSTFIIGMIKKSKTLLALAFFIMWIIIFYIPAWLFEKSFVASVSHRYLALSGLGLLEIFALLISLIRNKKLITFLAIVLITVNIYNSNRILKRESIHRSINVVDKIWDQVVRDVPTIQQLSLFMFYGDNEVRQSVVDLSGETIPWPYIVKLEIDETKYFPTKIKNKESILGYICQNQHRLKLEDQLSNLHVWNIDKNSIENVSRQEREDIRKEIQQRGC